MTLLENSKNFPSICQMPVLFVFKKLIHLEIYVSILGSNIFSQMESQSMLFIE